MTFYIKFQNFISFISQSSNFLSSVQVSIIARCFKYQNIA